MATIPRYTSRAQSSPLRISTAGPATPQGSFGPDLSGVSGEVMEIASRAQDRANTAQVMEADSLLTAFENNALYDPQSGALNTRGKNAFGLPEDVLSSFDERANEIRQNLRGQQVAAFNQLVAQRRSQINRTLQRHVSSEIAVYEKNQADALIAGSQISAANHYNDPERLAMELRRQRGAIMARSKDMGWSPERTSLAIQQAESATHGAVIDRMAANDPQAALQYYALHKFDMSPADRTTYDAVVKTTRQRYQADAVVGAIVSGQGSGAEGVWARMIQQESGGRQFDADGQPLTSSAGAIGIAQVMPDTAPQAARMAGLPWDEERYRTDADYNLALGKAYFESQVEKYGHPALAAAAYNAGPGNVDTWLETYGDPRSGEISLDEWIEKIPFAETQGYVRKVASGSEPREMTRSQQLAVVNQLPPDVRAIASERLNQAWAVQDQRLAEIYEGAQQSVESGTSFYALDPRTVQDLTADQIAALKSRSKELSGEQPTMDWRKWTEVSSMSREQLAAIDDPYTALRPHLDNSHYEKALQLVNDAKGLGEDINTSATLTFNQRVKNSAMQSGIVPADETPSQYSEDEALTFARFQSEAANRIEERERQTGRKLTGNEQQEVIDEMLTETINVDSGWFGTDDERYTWSLPADAAGDAYVPMSEIPPSDADFIRNLLTSNGNAPSNDLIQKAFAQYRLGNIERFQQIIARGN